ncbi:phosphoadenosine phosphosulfate reductase family protein [Dysgonomonas sp. ZJ709]|uniref:phosphoadenosine phosphosulfate reductase domain-containing protein n=1 Tax=Dysgonomonas sp. ZJ709 TaxID=2709797 RepID=UPI0013EBFDB5|nr:phosphoadenosine phosphosulfate reductase family protein [Dysgonomonas sp. ZJ709]
MFKITWDKENNGVLLTMKSSGEILNVSPRPVFFEELDLLGLNKYWDYPKSNEPLLWACDRRYFYKGELVLEARGGNIYDDPQLIFTDTDKRLKLEPIDIDLLSKQNEATMFLLEHEALEFINTMYRRYNLKNINEQTINKDVDFDRLADMQEKKSKEKYSVIKEDCDSFDIMPLSEAEKLGKQIMLSTKIEMFIASFSGGKDSQVVLDLVSRAIPSNDFLVIYSDTGYEIPPSLEIYKQTKIFYQKQYPDLKFYLSRNHQSVLHYWDKMGSPSRMHRWCCGVMKTAPLYRLLKEIQGTGKQPNVLVFEGVRSEESNRRALYDRIGKGVKHNNVVNARPIFDWNATEIYLYLFMKQLPINKGYRNGLWRVGCSICPYSSDWSEHIVAKKYPDSINPFISNIIEKTSLLGITDEKIRKEYVKSGNWKLRSGGKTSNPEKSRLDILSTTPDFKAVLIAPKENLLTWMNVLGKIKTSQENNLINGELKYKKAIYHFSIQTNDNKQIIIFENIGDEILLQGHIKRVLYKATYCVHCETCEVECPTGALSVVPLVSVDVKKCIHCHKCLDFKERGCVMASSINISEGNTKNSKMKTSGIDKYSTFGMKENWISDFFTNPDDYFEGNNSLGTKMIPACLNWFREAEILERSSKKISKTGILLQKAFGSNPTIVWEIMWVNLSYNSKIIEFYTSNIIFNRLYSKKEILELMIDVFIGISEATLGNPLGALCNMFGIKEQTIIGDILRQGIIIAKGNSVATISRQYYNDISSVAIAYSLYRYAESKKRYALTVSELYDPKQTEGVYQQFGVPKERFETILRTLKEDKNRVLSADLNMGLDNINLREDLTSMDILEILL